ncbi:hypothetical protein K443DRAFT_465382 [Laccaria amethystina LaAM-08-1]|uniref:Uncharacterized protein n=1 Tax=Laccaria amethystina LaAM-08-1 TaxID=1095629 RepID=A0A0C9Y6L8_9AGAR|nr:hypothetical protein K443DRAFT_465382 [Laccaria amethystina LaAM-08-1]
MLSNIQPTSNNGICLPSTFPGCCGTPSDKFTEAHRQRQVGSDSRRRAKSWLAGKYGVAVFELGRRFFIISHRHNFPSLSAKCKTALYPPATYFYMSGHPASFLQTLIGSYYT